MPLPFMRSINIRAAMRPFSTIGGRQDDDRQLPVAQPQEMARGGVGPAPVVDVDDRVRRRLVGVDQHRRDAYAVQDLERPVVGAEAEAYETVDRRVADGAFERAVQR